MSGHTHVHVDNTVSDANTHVSADNNTVNPREPMFDMRGMAPTVRVFTPDFYEGTSGVRTSRVLPWRGTAEGDSFTPCPRPFRGVYGSPRVLSPAAVLSVGLAQHRNAVHPTRVWLKVGMPATDTRSVHRPREGKSPSASDRDRPPQAKPHRPVVEPATNADLGSTRIDASFDGYEQLLSWSMRWPDRVWAVENAHGLGHHLSQWLIRRDEVVVDVPSTATARVRELSRGARRKTDRIDAAAAATCVAFSQGDHHRVAAEGDHAVVRLLDERRRDVSTRHSRAINQLHALVRDLHPGGVATKTPVEQIRKMVLSFQPQNPAETARVNLAIEILGDLRRLQYQLDDLNDRLATAVHDSGSTLTDINGVGPICAARLLARTGDPTRFPSEAAFAAYVGTAPIDASSGENNRQRLSRGGDRQLNSIIHIIALSQAQHPSAPGYHYYRRKLSEGKTPREARRCLKRQITKRIWRTLQADATPAHHS